jgi:hypothetical protein
MDVLSHLTLTQDLWPLVTTQLPKKAQHLQEPVFQETMGHMRELCENEVNFWDKAYFLTQSLYNFWLFVRLKAPALFADRSTLGLKYFTKPDAAKIPLWVVFATSFSSTCNE